MVKHDTLVYYDTSVEKHWGSWNIEIFIKYRYFILKKKSVQKHSCESGLIITIIIGFDVFNS